MATLTNLELLRRFEPIIHYTRGETFFPIDVARYVEACNMWVKRPGEAAPVPLHRKGRLNLELLAQPRTDKFGSVFFLKFTDPLSAAELATYRLRESFAHHDQSDVFHAGRGRLARVGYLSRVANALFLLSLLARGRVPGDAAAAASIKYKHLQTKDERYAYCGRVLRENGWLVLQYWFLYAFNNWRSSFYGLNDHEGDWEMVSIYLSTGEDGEVSPEWVAYASHDFSGDDLRRRWDDPELEKVGEHPVVYAGAGSHASYFTAGEYLVELEIPFLTPLARLAAEVKKFVQAKLRQYYDEQDLSDSNRRVRIFHLPFVDYARGDGMSIGPGQKKCWTEPYVISEPPGWVSQYRGLWGLHIQDPFAGENAPGGPMYNRDGTVRRAWYDPVGWAGLDKQPPANQALNYMLEQHAELTVRQTDLDQLIAEKSRQLTGLGIEADALLNRPHLQKIYQSHQEQIKDLAQELDQLRAEAAENSALLEAFRLYAQRLMHGQRSSSRAHIRRAAHPILETELRLGRLMETWAAISTGLILISTVGLIMFAPQHWFLGLIALATLFVVIESAFRRRLTQIVTNITIGLAFISALVLAIHYFPQIAIIGTLGLGAYMMWENLRELWS